MAAGDLHALALEYLDAINAALAGAPGGQIDRRFISAGLPDWDCCPQLSVHVASDDDAETSPVSPILAPGHRIAVTGIVNIVPLTATILRCVPAFAKDGKSAPAAADLTAAAAETNGDLWTVWNYLVHAKAQKQLFSPAPDGNRREVTLDPAVSLRSQGGCGGWAITVRVQLDGYQPTLA